MSRKTAARAALVASLLLAGCAGASVQSDDASLPDSALTEDARESPPLLLEVVPDLESLPVTADYLIISADELWETAQAFASYRTACGYQVRAIRLSELLSSPTMADNLMVDEMVAWVRSAYDQRAPNRPFYLLLVGDAVESGTDPTRQVPVGYWSGGWENSFGDNVFADMDYDHVPDLAVGRIPVSDNTTGLDVLSRIIAHETEYEVGPWNRRLNVYAGEGGFGEDIDFFIETIAQEGLESVPYEYNLTFAYNSPGSSYYYTPFKEKVLDLVTDGALLVTFMGHGGGELNVPDLAAVVPEHRQPMVAWFACSTGDYPGGYESDAEEVFKQPGGPMATLVSTATTHPYANAINALEIEAALFADGPDTYGEAIRLMKWRSKYHTSPLRELIDAFARMNMPEAEMVETVNDHMYSYNLLGDPAVRIRFPMGRATLAAATSHAGEELAFTGEVDNFATGTGTVELVCARATILQPLTPLDNPQAPENQLAVQQNWANANDKLVATTVVAVTDGAFAGTLPIPQKTPGGSYYLTFYGFDKEATVDAAGSTEVLVTKVPQ